MTTMSSERLFILVLLSALLLLLAARAMRDREWILAAALASIPIAGWVSTIFGH